MKRFGIALTLAAILGLFLFAAAGCNGPQKLFIDDVRENYTLIVPKFLEYVHADASLTDKEKEDWVKISESFHRLIEKAEKASD